MKIHDKTKVPELLKIIKEIQGSEIQLGILGSGAGGGKHKKSDATILDIANWNEFGTRKMPERSFIRASYDDKRSDYERQGEKLLEQVIAMTVTPSVLYETLGQYMVGQTQDYLTKLSSPPNHPFTIMMKKSSNPLIDTGQMRDSIEYKVKKV